ncbi:hypothetical protein BD289DRAFT_346994, partial [Coniella lustricola]
PPGETAWLNLIEEESRIKGRDLNSRVDILERYKQAINAEFGSIRLWIAYCDYFWSLYLACYSRSSNGPGFSPEEKMVGREAFSLDAALSLWQQGYEATRYRLGDSHELWNRWISLEMELLSTSRTNEGIRRITHLFRNRLVTPHKTWEDTSQMFSTFLSDYNRAAYETTMQEITTAARDARTLWDEREAFELKILKAQHEDKVENEKETMLEYLDWEMKQNRRGASMQGLLVEICLGLYSRALTGIFARDDGVWTDYVVWLSSLYTVSSTGQASIPDLGRLLPNLLDTLQRAVQHCPWAGSLWARYIMSAEEVGLSYDNIERIKHAATASGQLDKDGMTGVIDMYAAWCGFLKRRAMNANATDEDSDVAEIGLTAALEDVDIWGRRLYGHEYKGDPNFRLQRIHVQYLTEKKATIDGARQFWNDLAKKPIYADSYNFWVSFYMWEMAMFSANKPRTGRSPTTPASKASKLLHIPSLATNVLARAVKRGSIDWPEKVYEMYLQHCNDYESPEMVRRASDTVHKGTKAVARRRKEEQAAAYSAQMAQYEEQSRAATAAATATLLEGANQHPDETSPRKRVRDDDVAESAEASNKRVKSEPTPEQQQHLKRDRENTSIYVSKLPSDATKTKIRQYFRDYGHIKNLETKHEDDGKSVVCLIEFDTPDQAQSALLRNGKYFGQDEIAVTAATGVTLFVTNYPPHADDQYIRNLFKSCGDIFSIRWPSLKFNTHRRFCYVSFRTAEAAAQATALSGKILEGRFKLEAKHSNPGAKKQRDGAIEQGREVHVTSLPQDASESDVRSLFAKYGQVERVRLLTDQAGKSRGSAFVALETKEQAETAIAELDKTKFRNQILNVDKSKPVNFKPVSRTGPASSASSPGAAGTKDEEGDETMADGHGGEGASQGGARTFAIMGLPDTMNDARARALVELHGQLSKLTLRPDHGGAIVEFVDAATAGKAQLSLNGVEVEGRRLKTGSVTALFHEKGETRIDRVDQKLPPSTSASLAGKPTTLAETVAESGDVKGDNTSATAPNAKATSAPPKKSNADFRALLLGSQTNKEDDKKNHSSKQAQHDTPMTDG